jgi:zinc protease
MISMRKLIGLFIAVVIFSGTLQASQAGKLFDYQKTVLDNGLTVITLEDFSCPIVAVQVWYQVGSRYEDPNRQGFAHMFEHMMFRGTDRLGPEEHFSIIRSVGGSVNGYTSFDRTVYLETLPVEQIDVALWLEAERMAFLKITQEYFDTERKVVEEELRMRLNKPYGTVTEKLFEGIFTMHPYRWMPIGQLSHLRAASVDELRNFWQTYYGPENATLIIVGAIKHQQAQQLAGKYFSWIEGKKKLQQVAISQPYPDKPVEIRIKGEKAPAPVVGARWLTVPASNKDTVALDMLSIILGSGKSSRIYMELVDQKRLAMSADAGTYSLQQAGFFEVEAGLPQTGGDPNKVMELIEASVAKIRNEGVSRKELEKAKNQMLRSTVTQNLEIENKATALGQAALDIGDVNSVNTEISDIKKVTTKDIRDIANKYLRPNRVYRVYVEQNVNGPVFSKNSGQDDANSVANKSAKDSKPGRGNSVRPDKYPKSAPLAKSNISGLKPLTFSRKLDNGLNVLVVPNKEVPFVTVQLGIKYGGWTDEVPGTCSMAMSLIDTGTKKYTAAQLAGKLDSQAISLSASGNIDTSNVAMSCVSDKIENGMNLLAEVVLNPVFPAVEFDKQKEKLLTNLAVKQQTPDYIADKEFRKKLYRNHPYSRTATGEVEDINKLSAEICKEWWNKFSQPNEAVLIFAGDIDKDKAFKLAAKNFGKWRNPVSLNLKNNFAVPDNNAPTRIYLINYPGSQQSQIRIGQIGITRKMQPEYFTSRIVSDYFGYGFNSRLNKSIRVEKGLTYGVWGGYFANNLAGEFKIDTFSKTVSTADAIRALLDEVKLLKNTPPTETELAQSKSYIAGSFVINRETPQQIAQDLWLIKSQGLSDDYLDRLLYSVQNTKMEDCRTLVEKTITPDNMIIVVVGDAKILKEQLEKIAPVTLINQNDNIVQK